MEDSILRTIKKILNLSWDYTAFDLEVITHINSVFSIICQLGVGPTGGFFIEDEDAKWSDFECTPEQLNLVKTYISRKVQLLFDPPTMSFLIESTKRQCEEYEWRLNVSREVVRDPQPPDYKPIVEVAP